MITYHIYLSLQIIYEIFPTVGVPSCPENVRVTDTIKSSATLEWKSPESDGGSRITRYYVYQKTEKSADWRKITSVDRFSTITTINNLAVDETYFFAVAAENDVGVSEKGETTKGTTIARPIGE